MKSQYTCILILLFFFTSSINAISQNLTFEIRDVRVLTSSTNRFLEFKVYLTRTTPETNLHLGHGDLRINFPSEFFINPALTAPAVTGEIITQPGGAAYGITPSFLGDENGNPTIINLNINAPTVTHFPDQTEDDFGEPLRLETYNIPTTGVPIGAVRISGLKADAGTINLTWRQGTGPLAGDYPTKIHKFEETSEDGMALDGTLGVSDQFLISASSAHTFINPGPIVASDLHVHFTGSGSASDLFKIHVQTPSYSPIAAGSIGYYLYYRSDMAEFISLNDDQVQSGGFGWTAAPPRSVTVESAPIGSPWTKKGIAYDRRIVYDNNDGSQTGDLWPKFTGYTTGSPSGMTIASVQFKFLTEGPTPNRVYFEDLGGNSFKNDPRNATYTLYFADPGGQEYIINAPVILLPITLTKFTAAAHPHEGVVLKWSTAMEKDNREFIIQRSSDAKTFIDVKSIPGAGNSTQTRHYTSTDEYPLAGTSYYRLAQVDLDGTTTYSKVVAVNQNKTFSPDASITDARPNPFHNKTEINFQVPADSPVSITLTDALGKVIATDKLTARAGTNTYTLKGDHLANGIYFFTLHTGTESSRFKLVKNR